MSDLQVRIWDEGEVFQAIVGKHETPRSTTAVPTARDLDAYVEGLVKGEVSGIQSFVKTEVAKGNTEIQTFVQTEIAKIPKGAGQRVELTFTDADLSLSGVLVKPHTLGKSPATVQILDPLGETVSPDSEAGLTTTSVAIALASFRPLQSGQWKLVLTG